MIFNFALLSDYLRLDGSALSYLLTSNLGSKLARIQLPVEGLRL